jgi:hypothetical protein
VQHEGVGQHHEDVPAAPTRLQTRTQACTHARTHARTHAYASMRIRAQARAPPSPAHSHLSHTHTCTHAHTHAHARARTHTHAHIQPAHSPRVPWYKSAQEPSHARALISLSQSPRPAQNPSDSFSAAAACAMVQSHRRAVMCPCCPKTRILPWRHGGPGREIPGPRAGPVRDLRARPLQTRHHHHHHRRHHFPRARSSHGSTYS